MQKLVDMYLLEKELNEKTDILEMKNIELQKLSVDLKLSREKEMQLRLELEAWAPPFLIDMLQNTQLQLPMKIDMVVITFDLVDSSKLHDQVALDGRPIRKLVMNAFSEVVIKYGGWKESSSGDSSYAHFGVIKLLPNPVDAAFAAATEFRVLLRNISTQHKINLECGIGLHFAKNNMVDMHKTEIKFGSEVIIQKYLDSSSPDVDLVHRIEKLVHRLPGTNIILTKAFLDGLSQKPFGLQELGYVLLKGQTQPSQLFLKTSDLVSNEDLYEFKKSFYTPLTAAA
jgi:class 3 adenylate cyclase